MNLEKWNDLKTDSASVLLKTGNATLDRLLRGGIKINSDLSKHGMVVVLRGSGGTGKTTLALQMTHALAYSYSNLVGLTKKDRKKIEETEDTSFKRFIDIEDTRKHLKKETDYNKLLSAKMKLESIKCCDKQFLEELGNLIGSDFIEGLGFPIETSSNSFCLDAQKSDLVKELDKKLSERSKELDLDGIISSSSNEISFSIARYANFSTTENTREDVLRRLSRLVVAKDLEDCCLMTEFPYGFPNETPKKRKFTVSKSEKGEAVAVFTRTWKIKDLSIREYIGDFSDRSLSRMYSIPVLHKQGNSKCRYYRIFYQRECVRIAYPTNNRDNNEPLGYNRFTAFIEVLDAFLNDETDYKKELIEERELGAKNLAREINKSKNLKIEELKQKVLNSIAERYAESIVEPWIEINGIDENENRLAVQATDTATAIHHIRTKINQYQQEKNGNDESASLKKPLIFTIDGLGAMVPEERNNQFFSALVSNLRAMVPLSILTLEDTGENSNFVDHQADLVIEMRANNVEEPIRYLLHEMQITKSRYQNVAYGWHQYKMREWGMVIYPSSHFLLHRFNYVPQQFIKSFGQISLNQEAQEEIDAENILKYVSIIEGVLGITQKNREKTPGSTIALMGSRGCFKTALSLDFLTAGGMGVNREDSESNKSENGLIISLIDDEYYIRESMKCQRLEQCKVYLENRALKGDPGNDEQSKDDSDDGGQSKRLVVCDLEGELEGKKRRIEDCCSKCSKRISQFYQRTGCITSSELLANLEARLEDDPYVKKKVKPELEEKEKKAGALLQKPGGEVERLVFWDITQLDHRFPFLNHDPMFIPALFELVKKKKKMRGLFMGSMNAHNSASVSTIADNMIFTWRDSLKKGAISVRTESDRKIDREDEYLLLFVDRSEGSIGRDNKGLYSFPILDNQTLKMPSVPWNPREYRIPRKKWGCFKRSEEMIQKIQQLQGL